MLPCIKWKLDELISNLPAEALMKLEEPSPKNILGDRISTFEPLSVALSVKISNPSVFWVLPF